MKAKNIYWIVGIVTLIGSGFYAWKRNKNEVELNVAGGVTLTMKKHPFGKKCPDVLPQPPMNQACKSWEWNSHKCVWECKKTF
jgi:hypothetical protein